MANKSYLTCSEKKAAICSQNVLGRLKIWFSKEKAQASLKLPFAQQRLLLARARKQGHMQTSFKDKPHFLPQPAEMFS